MYLNRILEKAVLNYLKLFPVVGITGPRQSGKSTMLKNMLKDKFRYVTFDDYRMKDLFNSDPEKFMKTYNHKIIFDEVHKAPELFNYIKRIVDNDRSKKGQFILTDSSQFFFHKKISDSLAGRIGLLSLLPFEFSEVPPKLINESHFKGAYPELVMRKYRYDDDWYSSYLSTYINRDVREITKIGDLTDFSRLVKLLATRTAQILNISELSRDLGVSVNTIKHWISVLEASYIIFLLNPYYENLGKRIIKSPKIYFYDVGLVSFLTGVDNSSQFEKHPLYGSIFENYIVLEVKKYLLHRSIHANIYYYRTSHGLEIDLIIEYKGKKQWVEIKSSETFKSNMLKNMNAVIPDNIESYLVYKGETIDAYDHPRILNYSDFLKDKFMIKK